MEQIFEYLFPDHVTNTTALSRNIRFQKKICKGILLFSPNGVQLLNELIVESYLIFGLIVALNNSDPMPVQPSFIDILINNVDSILVRPLLKFALQQKLENCQRLIHDIAANHLTQKSHDRINFIFNFISTDEFLTYMFDSNSTRNHAIIEEMIIALRTFIPDDPITG
ncbi:unnamed protein product [Adineta steineri]|uniref:Uncharacterized protein n=1 Tax=Adineta steineri TaxID=433720 RepID=A0A819CTA5_9BILA|nr:unnamed protein product [Adineta steineri]CAF1193379.1 unnamed protein product [Adineta steineri]CAF3823107.1 unnamed protein product [Adineta steineri]CAF4105549.1 unnamed protein product [Adineta steineri]